MLEPKLRALRSLQALSIGDAFGELFFTTPATALVGAHPLPPGPWTWTDDTHMALSITEALLEHGSIDQDDLAQRFACRFAAEPWRGYAGGAKSLLTAVARGEDWRPISRGLFGGTGSWGNGAAMRVAPLGAFFANDVSMAVAQARWSAEVTHAHEEGVVGAVVVAAAAALRWAAPDVVGNDLLDAVLGWTPASRTRERIEEARSIAADRFGDASLRLGTGEDVAAWDTVPYCLWMCAHHGRDFELAMKATAAGLGDRDTTCAIVAGIVAPESADIPERWARETESLPDGLRMGYPRRRARPRSPALPGLPQVMTSSPVRLLFVCSRNQWRSPTAEALYRRDPRCEVRSAGTASSARRRVGERDLAWADVVVVMESHHRAALHQRFGRELVGQVRVLEVPDEYAYMDPTLIELLQEAVDALLDELLA